MNCASCRAILRAANAGPLCGPCLAKGGVADAYRRFMAYVTQGGSWRLRALCMGREQARDPRGPTWFPERSSEARDIETVSERRAKRICAMCPVKRECLTAAFAHREGHGLWAGIDGDRIRKDIDRVRLGRATTQEMITLRLTEAWAYAAASGLVGPEDEEDAA